MEKKFAVSLASPLRYAYVTLIAVSVKRLIRSRFESVAAISGDVNLRRDLQHATRPNAAVSVLHACLPGHFT